MLWDCTPQPPVVVEFAVRRQADKVTGRLPVPYLLGDTRSRGVNRLFVDHSYIEPIMERA